MNAFNLEKVIDGKKCRSSETARKDNNGGGQHNTGCGNDNLLFNSTDLAVKKTVVVGSPGLSRFDNAGRPARTGMISSVTLFLGAAPVEAGQQPGRVPVNPDWLRRFIPVVAGSAPVKAGSCPGESRQRPNRVPVYRNTAGTHRVYTGIRPRQSYGNAPVSPRSSPVMPRRIPGECRSHSGRAPRGYNFFEELRQTLGIGDPGLTVKVIHYENVLETIAFKDHFKMHKVESRASYTIYVVAALNI
ncbi:hypothetical protein DPMN_054424 [Dreissena polymorpha]|uniref:Uncharacterized protein n=1 Tax=Dreissena polymorpha TaxID=45954 RepID=A0A9D4CPU8_DREPO|nr:hypothetical protein DPMN_054424 [Dreissena polymorpha]